jgi:hypothetical protein
MTKFLIEAAVNYTPSAGSVDTAESKEAGKGKKTEESKPAKKAARGEG